MHFSDRIKLVLSGVETALSLDPELAIAAGQVQSHFALKGQGTNLVHITSRFGSFTVSVAPSSGQDYTLVASEDAWKEFFAAQPRPPYQSYWGMLRVLGRDNGVLVEGNVDAFVRDARVWRLVLDRTRHALHGRTSQDSIMASDEEAETDEIVGRYLWIETPFGRTKIFYETAGSGPQPLLFLHTAGGDSRQYHSLMNSRPLQKRCTMYAVDLPGHGRSFPGPALYPGAYELNEEFYISVIGQVIRKLNLQGTVVSGASMAGHACLAVALRAAELGVIGVIPCEAADHIPASKDHYAIGSAGNESIVNPERVCGLISPTAPAINHRLIWWIYSSQAFNIFPGDLKFYFNGWDARDRVHLIDTTVCPVYMLTGEYDYSCTPAASRATAAKINGAVFEEMKGLGHFPMTEEPEVFLPYFLKALDFINTSHST